MLMKPTTYMNNSGQAVVEAMNFYKIPPENVIVIFDDISLDVGKMRIRSKGSDGGQRGMRSIIYLSGSDKIPPHQGWHRRKAKSRLGSCRLGTFKVHPDEMKKLDEIFDNAEKAIELIIDGKTTVL